MPTRTAAAPADCSVSIAMSFDDTAIAGTFDMVGGVGFVVCTAPGPMTAAVARRVMVAAVIDGRIKIPAAMAVAVGIDTANPKVR